MGTEDPLVHIEAATLAGGDNNQDRYAYGDRWAFVLDGASSFSETRPVHDGAWYAGRLKDALVERLSTTPSADLSAIVAEAIQSASAEHDSVGQGPCPTSTIALVRWAGVCGELYVLGDSYCWVRYLDGTEYELVDDRIDAFGSEVRQAYQRGLLQGNGFNDEHRRLLADLQAHQLRCRNRPSGYWIAGNDPKAAEHARRVTFSLSEVDKIVLCTDGLRATGWTLHDIDRQLSDGNPKEVLKDIQREEANDRTARQYPRAKRHDDKTVIRLGFRSRYTPPAAEVTGAPAGTTESRRGQ